MIKLENIKPGIKKITIDFSFKFVNFKTGIKKPEENSANDKWERRNC